MINVVKTSAKNASPLRTLNLRKVVNCPHCWEQFPPEDVLWISQHIALRGDKLLGADAQQRFLPTRFNVAGNAFDAEGQICQELACPRCHLGIPRAFLELPSMFFSIVGTPSCGKSYFLASMTWQLRQLLPERFALSFADADPSSNRVLNYYEEQQFYNPNQDALVKLAKTEEFGDLYDVVTYGEQEVRYPRPFVFSVRPLESHPNGRDVEKVARALCLYDNAGESFEPGKDQTGSPVTRHLAQAQAIFYLYDPTQDPRFRRACQGLSSDPQLHEIQVTARQEITLYEMANRVRKHAGLSQQQRHTRPVIVIVTKQDAWGKLLPEVQLRPPYLGGKDPHLQALDLPWVEEISKKVRALLFKHTPELVSAVEGFAEQVIYVPVSATGCAPEKDAATGQLGLRPRDVKPLWVEVPLLWYLAKYGSGLVPFKPPAEKPAG